MSRSSKISMSLPLELLIRVDIIREKTDTSRSAWIKKSIEDRLLKMEKEAEETNKQQVLNLS